MEWESEPPVSDLREAFKLSVPLFLYLKIEDNTCYLLNLKGICED